LALAGKGLVRAVRSGYRAATGNQGVVRTLEHSLEIDVGTYGGGAVYSYTYNLINLIHLIHQPHKISHR